MKIGFAGTGRMGAAMVRRLIDSGHQLTVWNRTADKLKPLIEAGATAAATPRELAESSDLVITILSNAQAVEALFSVAYTAKFMLKKSTDAIDYVVMPLEGLWWSDDLSAFVANDRARWKWTMMIMQPSFVSGSVISAAIVEARRRRPLPAIDRMRLEEFTEGPCAQILHVGPFADEGPTIQRLHNFIESRGVLTGKHHEIYLTDIRRADPKNWKTIIRQPMR